MSQVQAMPSGGHRPSRSRESHSGSRSGSRRKTPFYQRWQRRTLGWVILAQGAVLALIACGTIGTMLAAATYVPVVPPREDTRPFAQQLASANMEGRAWEKKFMEEITTNRQQGEADARKAPLSFFQNQILTQVRVNKTRFDIELKNPAQQGYNSPQAKAYWSGYMAYLAKAVPEVTFGDPTYNPLNGKPAVSVTLK